MQLNYRLNENRCALLSKERVYYEVATPIYIKFDIPFCYRKQDIVLNAEIDGKSYQLPIVNNTVMLPDPTAVQVVVMSVNIGSRVIDCDPIEVKSIVALQKEVNEALPEYANLVEKYSQLEYRIKQLEDKHKIIL